MLKGVNQNLSRYEELRKISLDNSVPPPLYFNPVLPGMPVDRAAKPFRARRPPQIGRPRSVEEIAFLPVTHLAELMRTKQVTSVELTEIYLDRLKRYGPTLNCVVTLTEERGRQQAHRRDDAS